MKKKHIALLIAGGLLLLSTAFHENIWFDESYTAALLKQSLPDMLQIGVTDVHPLLYYILLKAYSLIAGTSIVALRIFSVIGAQLLAVLGLTHIRKDFGEKVGFWYSFIIYTTAAVFRYATEIRMYTWLPLFVTLCAIYGYRFYKNTKIKDMLLFAAFGLCAAYTQYFGLVTVCVINAALLIALIVQKHKKTMFFIAATLQILFYVPGFCVLFHQIKSVAGGYWIEVKYPDILIQTLSFFFLADTPDSSAMFETPGVIKFLIAALSCALFLFCIIRLIQKKAAAPLIALVIFFGMTGMGLAVSTFIQIFYVRYCMACAGLITFAFAVAVSDLHIKGGKQVFATLMFCCFLIRAVPVYKTIYSAENAKPVQFVKDNIHANDIILVKDALNVASVLAIRIPEIKIYILIDQNAYLWAEAYSAYQPQITMISNLADLPEAKNIWVLETWKNHIDVPTGEKTEFVTPYHTLHYTFSLLEGEGS